MSDVRFTSSNLIDKISLKTSGNTSVVTALAFDDYTVDTIPHSLGYIPNCIAIYAEVSDFSTYYVSGLPPYFFAPGPALYLPRIDCVIQADIDNIYIIMQNLDTTRTFYYKIIGVIPPDVTSAEPLDQVLRDDVLLTSDNNFCKIVEDSVNTETLGTFETLTVAVPHNLGYRPMALAYIVHNGRSIRSGQEASFFSTTGYTSRTYVDETNLYIEINTTSASGSFKVYGRVYLDD